VLFEVIKRVNALGEKVNFMILGNLGKDAKRLANSFRNVSTSDYLEPKDQARLLKSAHVGLYPRTHDHRRRVLKIYEYAGAGLPVVAFDLVDSIDVKTYDFGLNVNSIDEFVESILILKNNKDLYDAKSRNALKFSFGKDWESLATKLERLQY
jgi:glycosyltransferase involved in cell wall biosynthesis